MTNLEKYDKLFLESFPVSREDLPGLKYRGIRAWDSIGHMDLMSGMEETYGISISTLDVLDFSSYEKGKEILDNFSEYLPKFKKIIPHEFKKMQMAIVQMEEKGLSSEQAQIEAFYASMSENEK